MSGRKKRTLGGQIVVDEVVLNWSIRSEPQWNTTDGDIGLRLAIETDGKAHRELILEYPFQKRQKGPSRFPDRPKIDPEHLKQDILRAIEAGWSPHSRGRPFTLVLEEDDVAGRDGV